MRNDIWSEELLEQADDEIDRLRSENEDLAERIDELMDEIDELKKHEWISVKDRLPECEEPVLLWTDYGEICIASRSGDGKWYGSYQIIDNAVCWMPLPEPPEVEDNEAD